jgi:hypothetical protein
LPFCLLYFLAILPALLSCHSACFTSLPFCLLYFLAIPPDLLVAILPASELAFLLVLLLAILSAGLINSL